MKEYVLDVRIDLSVVNLERAFVIEEEIKENYISDPLYDSGCDFEVRDVQFYLTEPNFELPEIIKSEYGDAILDCTLFDPDEEDDDE